MALLRTLYLVEMFALQLVPLFGVLSAAVSQAPDARVITDVSVQRSWLDALQVRDARRHVARRKAPRFMMELYEETLRNPAILHANIVRSFPAQSNGAFHFFNLTSFGHREKLTRAEFRWFRRAQPVLPGHHFYRVDLYEVPDNRVKPWRGNLILSQLQSVYSQGWKVFSITQTVTKWILNSSINNGIMVVLTLTSGHWLESSVHSARESDYQEDDAYLVMYSDDGRSGSTKDAEVSVLKIVSTFYDSAEVSTSGQSANSPFLREFLEYKAEVRRRRSTRKRAAENQHAIHCQRTPLYVDFVKLGWSGWIISPSGYNAYHCSGSCPFPLSGSFHATNHAIVQSIVNTLKLSNEVGRPCCVPDNLQPISLLYFDDEENVVLKQYDDMVAGGCGCH